MKGEVDLKSGDLHANPSGFDAMGEGVGLGLDEPKGLWLEDEQEDLLGVTDSSIFYNDFPSLLDFTCMSSSSSSSTPVAAVKPATSSSSSSSSASSWAILKSDAEEDVDKKRMYDPHYHRNDPFDAPPETLSSTASMEIPQPTDNDCGGDGGFLNCMDVMENLGYMDILDSNDFFDPSPIFENNTTNSLDNEFPLHQEQEQTPPEESLPAAFEGGGKEREDQVQEDDMAMVFLEWLKSNRETVSADDLRNVKIKKSTIECAAKRLGGGKEAMKQLLKLVLEWVQKNHLQKRKNNSKETTISNNPNFPNQFQGQDPSPNQNPPNPNPNTINSNSFTPDQSNTCFTQSSPWISTPPPPPPPQPPYMTDPAMAAAPPPPFPQSIVGYTGDPYLNGGTRSVPYHPPPPDNYHMVESTQSWPPSQFAVASQYKPSFPDNNIPTPLPPLPAYDGFGNQYPNPYSPDDRLMRLGSSATKEARKKRMARQRRYSSRHRHHHQNHHGQQNQVGGDPHAMFGNDNYTTAGVVYWGNWVYWPPSIQCGMGSNSPVLPMEGTPIHPGMDRTAMQTQKYQGRVSSADRRQGWKPEKNLRFLLQKVLKQSDVGNLGRIVLPKKEAETHLPELEARDGIHIAMEDIGTSRVWSMRYRYWPNNKSRMYLLENTGDFVRANGLQEGDFVVIYSDVKCGKFMIRGVKVRQQGLKSESKREGKSQKNQHHANASRLTLAASGGGRSGGNGSIASLTKKH